MNTLVVNAGSVTVKYKLYGPQLELILSGQLDNKNGQYVSELSKDNKQYSWEITSLEFKNAAALIVNELKDYPLSKVAFRIVHGGEKFIKPTLLNEEVLEELAKISVLAPLHNPPTLERIVQFKKLLPEVAPYGVFDTAFHATMPANAYLYGLPYEYYSHYGIRRYGFHGISHQYLTKRMQELEPEAKKLISCHLGGGASITAIENGVSKDTSMGFTPLEGLIMATRAGDVDDGAIKYLQDRTGFSDLQMEEIENRKSGLLGISGYTADMRTLLQDEKEGKERAKLAIEMYIYRIRKYIGSFAATLNGVDAVVVTGGVGAGSDVIRQRIFSDLDYLNLKVDPKTNYGRINVSEDLKISSSESKPIWVIPANEELQIAQEVASLR